MENRLTADLPVVWSAACLRHVPGGEVRGVRSPGGEVPGRAEVLRRALEEAGARLVEARPHGDEVLRAVHEWKMVDHLASVWAAWVAAGLPESAGRACVVPSVFPTGALLGDLPLREPSAVHARAGQYCYDTTTVVGTGTWEAARAAVDTALTAVDLLLAGEALVYALCRPPGHHAGRSGYGGSCYLNNAACAAEALSQSGARRVAVLDLGAHHGNGTQAIFWDRGDVLVASVHVDPGAGWFPHYTGHADEVGGERGVGATLNLPLAPGTSDASWLEAVRVAVAAIGDQDPDAIVVSLGVDAARDDPGGPLAVSAGGYFDAGRLTAALGIPIVAVQEGGYHLSALNGLVVSALAGLAARP